MERARELSSAPVLTITPAGKELGYHFDVFNGIDSMSGRNNSFALENHGNGPALNLLVHFELQLQEPTLQAEVLVVEAVGGFASKCFASAEGIRWERPHAQPQSKLALHQEQLIVSLAKAEAETLFLSSDLMRRWVLDAISFNEAKVSGRSHVAHLMITVTYDTVLRSAQRASFKFRLRSRAMPSLGQKFEGFGGGATYQLDLEPIPL